MATQIGEIQMKKTLILLACILVFAICSPCLAQSEVDSQIVEHYLVSDLGKARYRFEHRILHDEFINNPFVVLSIMSDQKAACDMYQYAFDKLGVPFPYSSEDFSIQRTKINSMIYILTITPPKPEYTPLCRRIHLVFDPEYQYLSYFTVEHSYSSDFLCEWNGSNHLNYGQIRRYDASSEKYNELFSFELLTIAEKHAKRNGIPFKIPVPE